jgi:XdhC Rossmann domain
LRFLARIRPIILTLPFVDLLTRPNKTHAKRLERLRTAGFSDSELARIRAPVGLAIGAKGPLKLPSRFSPKL